MLGIMEKENKEIDLTDAHRKIIASLLMLYFPNTEEVATEVVELLGICRGAKSKTELKNELGLKNDEYFRKMYIRPAIESGLIEMTIPDKPNNRLQKYRITELGKKLLSKLTK